MRRDGTGTDRGTTAWPSLAVALAAPWFRRCRYRPGLLASLHLFLAMLMGGAHPVRAVTLTPGDIVVADPNETNVPGRIVRVDPDTCAQDVIADNLVQPYWVVIDPRGDLLVSDRGLPARIVRIDRSTGAQTVVSEGQFFGSPSSIAMAPSGELLVTERGTTDEPRNRILRIDLGTGVQTLVFPSSPFGAFLDLGGQPLVDAEGIAVAPGGDIFVVDSGKNGANDGRVIQVDQVTGRARVVAQAGYLEDPRGIVVETNGKLLVADPDAFNLNGAIIEVDPTTRAQTIVSKDPTFSNPYALAIEATGDLIVTDDGTRTPDRVLRVNRATGAVTTLASGGNFLHPWGVAIVTGPGSCGNGVLDPGEQCDDGNMRDGDRCSARCRKPLGFACIRLQLDELSDAVAARVRSMPPLRISLVKLLDRVDPAIQLAEDRVKNDAFRAAKKRLAKALRALRKFDQRLDSRPGQELSSTTRGFLHDKANVIRTALRALRGALE